MISLVSYSQVYRGIKEVEPYKRRLAKMDNYLQLNPKQVEVEYYALMKQAKSRKNIELESVLYIYKATLHYYTGNSDSSVIYFDKAIIAANKAKNEQLRSSAAIRRIFVIDGHNDVKISMRMMKEEFDDAKSRKDTLNMIYSLNGIAMYYERMDSTERCIDEYLNAMKLAQENNNQFEYGFLLNNLGLLKLRLKDPQAAYADFQTGMKIAKVLENIRLELVLKENLGYYYMEVDSLDQAEQEHKEALELATSKNFTALAFNSMINLGVVERAKGNSKKADSLMNEALQMARRYKLYYAISPIYLNMAQIAIGNKKYSQADNFLDSAMLYSKYTSKNEIQEGYYVLMSSISEKKGDYKEALKFNRLLTKFRDSLDKSSHLEMMKELQLKYNVEKEEKKRIEEKNAYEKKLAANALHTAKIKQNIGIGLIILLLGIGGFIIYYFRSKHKQEIEFSSAIVNKLEEERGRIARDLHDGLGQSLIVLKNKFNQLEVNDEEKTRQINENFTSTIEEVRSISRSLIPPELRRLGLKKSILKMLKDVEETSRIMTTSEIEVLEEMTLDDGQEIRIYRIIQELLNNTMKHSQATSLKITMKKNENGFSMTYQDNGIGFEHDIDKMETNSVGLRSIEQRLRYLNGTIKFEKPAKGFKATIKIKLTR